MLPSPCSLTRALTFCSGRTNLSQAQRAYQVSAPGLLWGALAGPEVRRPPVICSPGALQLPFQHSASFCGPHAALSASPKRALAVPSGWSPQGQSCPRGATWMDEERANRLRPDSVTGRSTVLVTEKIWQEEVIAETKKKKKNQKSVISHKRDSMREPHHLNTHYSNP